jgi:hypothetical protein
VTHILDATRAADGLYVVLKKVDTTAHPFEIDIGRFLQSPDLKVNPANHCVSILDVLEVPSQPNSSIIVMPLLRKYNDPRFESVGEVVDFFEQVFEVRSCLWYLYLYLTRPQIGIRFHAQTWCRTPVSILPGVSDRSLTII